MILKEGAESSPGLLLECWKICGLSWVGPWTFSQWKELHCPPLHLLLEDSLGQRAGGSGGTKA